MVEDSAGMVILLGSAMDNQVLVLISLEGCVVKAKLVFGIVLGVKAATWLQERNNKSAFLERNIIIHNLLTIIDFDLI